MINNLYSQARILLTREEGQDLVEYALVTTNVS